MLAIRSMDEDGKNLGLAVNGSGGGGRRRGGMEKNELAEGKACFGRDDDIDPDAHSYIDEKIQNVLGHIQKEFEGGVYAESLGAKYGGYGSFLPTYPRSPSISLQPKSPVKMPNPIVSRSPYNLQSQDGHQNPSVLGTTPITKVSIASGGQLTEKSGKNRTSINTHRSEGILQSLSKPVNMGDKKMQEVRIKVGHEDVFPRNKPDIYSDLGLDVSLSSSLSPSPSPEDIPNRHEECSSESVDAFLESPTTILQIMTCFSVPGGYILSPLPDSLQNSNGKEDIFLTNFKTGVLRNGQTETCAASSNKSLNLKFVNGSARKKIKSGDKSQMLRKTDGLTCKSDVMPFLKKETVDETLVAQKIICNAPNMSHSSRASCGDAREERQINGSPAKEICNAAGNFKDPDKLSLKERIPISNVSTDNLVELVESTRNDFTGNSVKEYIHSNGEVNSKSGLTTKSFGERIGNNQDTSCKPAEMESRALKNYNTTKADSRRYGNGWMNHNIEHEGPGNHNPEQKAASCEKDLLMAFQEIDQADDGGIVPKGSPTNDLPCVEQSKENLRTSSVELKRKNEFSYESKLKEHKSQKKAKKGKAMESHNGFGDSKHIQKVDENKHQIANSATDALAVASLACNAPTSDAPTIFASVIKENWVFCDLCQTWRLLPYGTNPDKLPKEWQCSMQVWLPGLNKCYISEDETTKAFHQLYQVPAPANGTYLNVHPDDAILNQNRRLDDNAYSIPSGLKRKHGLLDASNLPNSSSLSYSTSSGKNSKASSENRSLNGVIRDSLDKDSSMRNGIVQTSRSVDLDMEKHSHKVEEKPFKIPASCPNEGDLFGKGGKNSTLKGRRKVDLGHRSSVKIKKDALHYSENNVHNEDEIAGKMAIDGDCDLLPRASRKVLQSSGDHFSSKDFNSKVAFSKNPKEHFSSSRTEKICKYDSNDEKRGKKELQERDTHHKNSMISQQLVEKRHMIKDGSSESEQGRQKKAKLSNSVGQDSSVVIVDGKMDKKGCLTKIKLPSSKKYQPDKVVEGTIDYFKCMNAMNKDVANVQLVTEATSSSSKLLGSHRSKINLQEARESPVESVSSSPARLLNTKNNSMKVSLSIKDDILSTGPSMKGSSKSIFNGDVDASDNSGTMTKDPASKSNLIISKNSKVAKPKASSNKKVDHSSQIIVDRSEGSSGKMIQACHTATGKQEKSGRGSQTVHGSMKERNSEQYHADSVNSGASKSTKKIRKSDCLNEMHSKILSQPSPTVPECTPTKKDGHITINAFIQEARDLKHTASRLKNDGLERESSGIYFEASLKFLHVASLMEPPNSEFVRQGDFFPSPQMLKMYVDTARLCEFCAHEYENLKEMAAASLAYKCAEVAYMKVAYFMHPSASKDRHELQAALNAALPGAVGESTISSTLDVDNLNNQDVFEKAASTRATRSPQLAASYVIAARNHPHVKRLLTYTNYLNCAFEAANKSRNALAAASIDLDKDRVGSLCSVREVLDFNFINVERLLQLVQVQKNCLHLHSHVKGSTLPFSLPSSKLRRVLKEDEKSTKLLF